MTPICSCGRPLRLVETTSRNLSRFRLACVGRHSCGKKSAPYLVYAEHLTPELLAELPGLIQALDCRIQTMPVSGEVCLTRSA